MIGMGTASKDTGHCLAHPSLSFSWDKTKLSPYLNLNKLLHLGVVHLFLFPIQMQQQFIWSPLIEKFLFKRVTGWNDVLWMWCHPYHPAPTLPWYTSRLMWWLSLDVGDSGRNYEPTLTIDNAEDRMCLVLKVGLSIHVIMGWWGETGAPISPVNRGAITSSRKRPDKKIRRSQATGCSSRPPRSLPWGGSRRLAISVGCVGRGSRKSRPPLFLIEEGVLSSFAVLFDNFNFVTYEMSSQKTPFHRFLRWSPLWVVWRYQYQSWVREHVGSWSLSGCES